MTRERIVTSCTRDCPNTCGLIATVEDGRLVKLKGDPNHPLTQGGACHKTSKYVKRVYSPERVTFPLIKREGRRERAGWQETLDLVAEKIQTVVAESGPEAILYYQGYGERTALKLLNKRFFNLLGGATTMVGSLCGGAGQGAQNLDFGNRISHDPLDHCNSKSMILWARNPASTNISLVKIAKDIRKHGGRVVVIDPVRNRSASFADRHIAPKPGKDGYLAMAATKLILDAGVEDKEFLHNRAEGFEAYRTILDGFSLTELCVLAGVSEEDAQYLAETYMTQAPTSTLLGWGLHRHEQAHLAIRPIDALGAVSGNIGVPGGGVSQGFEEYGPFDPVYWGDDLTPDKRTFLIPVVGEEILKARDPKIRMIYVTAGNPICMAPNADKISRAFKKAEFVVYSGHFLDDTAEHADVVLPATTFLEEEDIVASYGHNYVGPVNPAIKPLGECKSEFQVFQELAQRFPFAAEYCKSTREWLKAIGAPIWRQGTDIDALRSGAFRLDAPMVPYADGVFETKSGKFEFMTEFNTTLLETEDAEFPYNLLTIAPHGFICSERTLAEHEALPQVTLNKGEAKRKGLEEGQRVTVRSAYGRLEARLRLDEAARPDVLVAERGGWNKAGHGVNLLTRDMVSAVGAGTPYYETLVTVEPCKEDGIIGSTVLVVQQCEQFPGGVFCKELARQGAVLKTMKTFKGDSLPDSPDEFDRLVVLGGSHHVFDDSAAPHLSGLMELMRQFDKVRKPVVGICHGSQMLARAYDAKIQPLPCIEFGYVQLEMTPEARKDPVLGAIEGIPPLMEFHENSFDLPKGAVLLVRGQECPNQAFKVGNCSYGFQFHLEADSLIIRECLDDFMNDSIEGYSQYRSQFDASYFTEMEANLSLYLRRSTEFCEQVARNWLQLPIG